MKSASPAKQLAAFLAKYDPAIQKQAKECLARLRKRLPTANQMVYDNWNGLVIGFAPNDRPSDAIFSLFLAPRYVVLVFIRGKGLPDPQKLLRGGGNQVRNIILDTPARLDDPAVKTLMMHALDRARVPLPKTGKGTLLIRSVSPKQRPRRPKAKIG